MPLLRDISASSSCAAAPAQRLQLSHGFGQLGLGFGHFYIADAVGEFTFGFFLGALGWR
jgi:hypothetical protein